MNFEWDEEKNRENICKHAFDFAGAWEIFESPMRVALDAREDYGEDRWNGIGLLGNRVVVVFSPSAAKTPFGSSPCGRR